MTAAAATLPFLACLLLRLAGAARPGLFTLVTAGFVSALVQGEGALAWALAFAAVQAVEHLVNLAFGPARESLRAAITLRLQHRVLACAARVPLARHFDPAFHDRLGRASRDLGERLLQWSEGVLHLVHAAAAVAGLVGAVFLLGSGVLLAGILLGGSLVGLLAHRPLARLELNTSQRTAQPRRLAAAWADLLAQRAAAAEIRAFGVQEWILGCWAAAYWTAAREALLAARGQFAWHGVGAAAAAATYGAVIWLAADAAARDGPAAAAGTFTALLLTGQALQAFMRELVHAAGRMHEHAGVIGDLALLFAEPQAAAPLPAGTGVPASVAIEDVTFRFPAAGASTLGGVSAAIAPGEVIALVGPNGAGKSTLAALVLGLLQPETGRVQVTGGPVAAVFQAFARYSLTVRDNVGFGDLPRLHDDPALRRALAGAGSALGGELDAWLSPEFGGRDLSGGEWLRVAIARGLLRQGGLVVLDEPAAAIDPAAEVDLVRRLLAVSGGRTALVVSHRLGIARHCSRILVMDQGRLAEQGTHEELLRADGLYARMWQAQASWYIGNGRQRKLVID